MSLRQLTILLALLASVCTPTSAQAGNANNFIDQVLSHARDDQSFRAKVDPLRLDNMDIPKGEVKDIEVTGILSLSRVGDASVQINGDVVTLTATLGVRDVRVKGNYRYRQNRILKLKGRLEAKLEELAVAATITANLSNGQARLENMHVSNFGKLKVTKITGVGKLLNWLLKIVVQKFGVDKNRRKIQEAIEKHGREAIEKALAKADISKLTKNL